MQPGGGFQPRVLVVPSSYFASGRTVGGGERYALEYARALSRLTPTTLALLDASPSRRAEDGLEVRTFAARTLEPGRMAPLTLESWRAVGAFDVLHVMIFPTPLSDLLAISAALRRQTLVLTDVGGGIPTWSTYLQKLHPRANLNRLADGLAHLSRHSSGHFEDWNQPTTILYGGADVRLPASGAAPDAGYALYVGRLLPHKGVLQLIESIGPTTPLRVVGRPYDGAYLDQLRSAAVGKNVEFVLDADDAELRRQYLGAAVVLQPSIPVNAGRIDSSELLGLVALEGMAHGKPVIVTRTASLPELVEDGRTGFVVDPGDLAALRDRVERLVGDAELSRSMGEAARIHVEQRFTWDRVAGRGLAFYRELRSGRSGRASAHRTG